MNRTKILYVEDEAGLARIMGITLKQYYEVTVANDGLSALENFKSAHFDICVVDIMLPKMDGYTLVQKIREINTLVPVIFLTARTLTDDVVKGFAMGGNDYLKKPFHIEELIARINELVKRSSAGKNVSHTYEIGSYKFNYHKMQLSHENETFVLTPRENEILKRFAEKKNEVVDTQQLLLELWGDDSFYNARSLNVFMAKIRKYFTKDSNISIVNIRAVGYKMIV